MIFETENLENLKIELATIIKKVCDERFENQLSIAKALKTDQCKVSLLLNLRLKIFTIEKLFSYLNILGFSVRVDVNEKNQL